METLTDKMTEFTFDAVISCGYKQDGCQLPVQLLINEPRREKTNILISDLVQSQKMARGLKFWI